MRNKNDAPLTAAERDRVKELRRQAKELSRASERNEVEPADVDPDNPPLTDEQLANLRAAHEVHPQRIRRKLGRPPAENRKRIVSLRLDEDVVTALKESGAG